MRVLTFAEFLSPLREALADTNADCRRGECAGLGTAGDRFEAVVNRLEEAFDWVVLTGAATTSAKVVARRPGKVGGGLTVVPASNRIGFLSYGECRERLDRILGSKDLGCMRRIESGFNCQALTRTRERFSAFLAELEARKDLVVLAPKPESWANPDRLKGLASVSASVATRRSSRWRLDRPAADLVRQGRYL